MEDREAWWPAVQRGVTKSQTWLNSWTTALNGSQCSFVLSFSCVWLFMSPWTVAHLSPSAHGIFQAKILEQFAISSSRGSSQPRGQTLVSVSLALQEDSLPLGHLGGLNLLYHSEILGSLRIMINQRCLF